MSIDIKIPRGQPRMRWVDGVSKDLEILKVTNWQTVYIKSRIERLKNSDSGGQT